MQDVKFMSASDKTKVLRQWEQFLKGGCKWEKFTKALYDHLHLHCSFIAHYNRAGFYGTYFESGDTMADFLSQFDERNAEANGVPRSIEYGSTWWVDEDYGDINREMIRIAGKYIPELLTQGKQSQKEADIRQVQALLAKHGITLQGVK